MIELPLKMRHMEADYASIILGLMDIPYEDKRLISLMSKETREELRVIFQLYIPVLTDLHKSMGDDLFMETLCSITEELHQEYKIGFRWQGDKRTDLDIAEIFSIILKKHL